LARSRTYALRRVARREGRSTRGDRNQRQRHVRGGRIRSVLGLREQLFVIEKKVDAEGRVIGFVFIGRGWGTWCRTLPGRCVWAG
jgi:hypothetical protein